MFVRHLVIDDRGQAWPHDSVQLHQTLRAQGGGFDAVDFAVRNLGFVDYMHAGNRLRLRLRPRAVADGALAATVLRIADDAPVRIALTWLGRAWNDEIHGSPRRLVQRIIDLVDSARADGTSAYLLQPRRPDSLAANDPLSAALRRWRESERRFAIFFDAALRARVADRVIVVETGRDAPALTVAALGQGFLTYDARYRRVAVGQRVEDQPDYAYGKWAAEGYREALARREPRIDDVDVMVKQFGGGRTRVCYRRLILPFDLGDGRTRLVGTSVVDPTIDLRRVG